MYVNDLDNRTRFKENELTATRIRIDIVVNGHAYEKFTLQQLEINKL